MLQERGSPCAPWGALETSEEGGRRGASSPGCSHSRWPGTAGGGARVSMPPREQGRRGWSLSATAVWPAHLPAHEGKGLGPVIRASPLCLHFLERTYQRELFFSFILFEEIPHLYQIAWHSSLDQARQGPETKVGLGAPLLTHLIISENWICSKSLPHPPPKNSHRTSKVGARIPNWQKQMFQRHPSERRSRQFPGLHGSREGLRETRY